MSIDKEKLKKYRISENEFQKITELLGRQPEGVEWALFSALWSEHCSYKSSKVHLRKFYGQNESVISEEGENAGIINLGQGEAVAFKMESHNHPSFIEPYEGAATGVGGILRDIFTMGARPIALANYLCFGKPKANRMTSLVDGVVRGISGYGNCVGVPMLTGQTQFDETYNENILVNAFALGLFREGDPILTSAAKGVGNLVVYVGAKTGRDGIHGASMSSESFDEDSESKRPTIQKGDPFYEKLLIESCLEVMKLGLVESIQDMGAAGLTSSSFEMSSKSGQGLSMHLDKVPLRDSSLTPEDILLSESQERMLLVCKPENLSTLQEVFKKWGLDAEPIGEVLEGKEIELYWRGEEICKIDPQLLTENAPRYEREYEKWSFPKKASSIEAKSLNATQFKEHILSSLGDENVCDKNWIYQQYDQRVGAKTVSDCSEPIGVVRLPDSGRGLGIALGCRTRLMKLDAALGAKDAIAYPALQLAIKGFKPLAVTDCLNFGNPETKEVMSEFVASVENISDLCREIDTPVISGNVSFYNETLGKSIASTPATALVGIKEDIEPIIKSHFTKENSTVALLKIPFADVNKDYSNFSGELSNPMLKQALLAIQEYTGMGKVSSTRMVGTGGASVALAKMSMRGIGCDIQSDFEFTDCETLYEILFETADFEALKTFFAKKLSEAQVFKVGQTAASKIKYKDIEINISDLNKHFKNAWGNQLGLS